MAENNKRVLAFDFGASSGRAMLAELADGRITMQEVHRFSNDPVMVRGTMYWDILRLFHEVKQGIIKAKLAGGFDSIAVDTWGVDFGLIDSDGRLLENPVHYRDKRTEGMLAESFKKIDRERFYNITGNQFMEINTAFQLLSLVEKRPELLEKADRMLLMPDLFNYLLCGEKKAEYSIASTTQMMDAKAHTWSDEVIKALGIPKRLLPDIVPCGTAVGTLSKDICDELDVPPVPVVAAAGHDTQAAMAAVPTQEKDFIFISCGTWSLFGTELDAPVIDDNSKKYNITNEGGYGFKTSFLKNIIGLWLQQESKKQWSREGHDFTWKELEAQARKAEAHKCFVDPDAPEFVPAGNIPKRVQEFCRKTGQAVPEGQGEIIRCILESLALKYRYTFEQIKDCTGKDYKEIHIVGGGAQNNLLCELTASACGVQVAAGPGEATVLGNIGLQYLALGDIKDISEMRSIVAASDKVGIYEPHDTQEWDKAYERFKKVLVI